ncbi:MAG: hypothetical protein K1X95_06595 [Acidimicrobiia bacterium]|nr:hypothetical protein [Acidimicrobiia bacterium]
MDYYGPFGGTDAGMSFYGPDTSVFDAELAATGGFYGPDTTAMWESVAGEGIDFYGPDLTPLQQGLEENFDPANPYMFEAMQTTTAYQESVYEDANTAWGEYFRQ